MSRCDREIAEAGCSPAERDVRRQVRGQRRFLNHLVVFLLVGGALTVFSLIVHPGRHWPFVPLLGWGVAVAIHGVVTLLRGRWLGSEWEAREVARRLDARGVK